MFCRNCGTECGDEKVCPACGNTVGEDFGFDLGSESFFEEPAKTVADQQTQSVPVGKAKFCTHCGHRVHEEAVVCVHCGCAIESVGAAQAEEKPKNNGMAIAGFVCSFFVPVLGWVFGGIGLAKAKKLDGKGKAFSIAAIAIASANWILGIILNSTMYY